MPGVLAADPPWSGVGTGDGERGELPHRPPPLLRMNEARLALRASFPPLHPSCGLLPCLPWRSSVRWMGPRMGAGTGAAPSRGERRVRAVLGPRGSSGFWASLWGRKLCSPPPEESHLHLLKNSSSAWEERPRPPVADGLIAVVFSGVLNAGAQEL